jgi:hypothetical protein
LGIGDLRDRDGFDDLLDGSIASRSPNGPDIRFGVVEQFDVHGGISFGDC